MSPLGASLPRPRSAIGIWPWERRPRHDSPPPARPGFTGSPPAAARAPLPEGLEEPSRDRGDGGAAARISRTEWLLLLLALAAVFAASYTPVWDPDSFWHLALGREMWRTGHLVRAETFTFSAPGTPWADLYWLFHLLTYPPLEAGGFPLLQAVTALGAVAAALLGLAAARAAGGTALGFCLFLAAFLEPFRGRIRLRPELASVLLFAALVLLLSRWRAGKSGPRATALLLAAVFAVWAQCHGGWLLGYGALGVAVAGEFLDAALARRLSPRLMADGALLLGLPAAATLLSPYGPRVVFSFLFRPGLSVLYDGGWVQVDELKRAPLDWSTSPWILACLLILAASAWRSGWRERRWGETLWVLCHAFLTLWWVRYCSFGWLALAPVGCKYLAGLERLPALRRPLPVAVSLALGLRLLLAAPNLWEPDTRPVNYPVEEVAFLKRAGIGGNLFHTYVAGGFLELEYFPLGRTFFDGRYHPFLREMAEYQKATGSPAAFREFLRRHPFEIALSPYNPTLVPSPGGQAPPRTMAALLFAPEDWAPVYYGAYGTVYLRRIPRLQAPIRAFEYRTFLPGDSRHAAWSVATGAMDREALAGEIRRALAEGSLPREKLEIDALILWLKALPAPSKDRGEESD